MLGINTDSKAHPSTKMKPNEDNDAKLRSIYLSGTQTTTDNFPFINTNNALSIPVKRKIIFSFCPFPQKNPIFPEYIAKKIFWENMGNKV